MRRDCVEYEAAEVAEGITEGVWGGGVSPRERRKMLKVSPPA